MLISLPNRRNCLHLYNCYFGDKTVRYRQVFLSFFYQKIVKILKVPNKIKDDGAEGNRLFMTFHQVTRIKYDTIYPSVLGNAVVFMN